MRMKTGIYNKQAAVILRAVTLLTVYIWLYGAIIVKYNNSHLIDRYMRR